MGNKISPCTAVFWIIWGPIVKAIFISNKTDFPWACTGSWHLPLSHLLEWALISMALMQAHSHLSGSSGSLIIEHGIIMAKVTFVSLLLCACVCCKQNGLNLVCIGLLSWSRTGEQLWVIHSNNTRHLEWDPTDAPLGHNMAWMESYRDSDTIKINKHTLGQETGA